MSISLKPIEQQVIVVTGASSGIGLATARAAAKRGAQLVLAARSEQTLDQVVRELRGDGARAIYVVTDVGSRQDVELVAEAAITEFGRVDTWVNNAGVSLYGRLDEVSEEDSRKLFDTNFWGIVNGSLVALRHMRDGGAIINIGSEGSDAALPLQGMYAATQHAVKGFTDALRIEVQEVDRRPVAITLIQPGAVNTSLPDNARNYMAKQPQLAGPTIEPEQVADAILDAATKPRRTVKVGQPSKLNTAVSKVARLLGDNRAAKHVELQQSNDPPKNPDGTLYTPGESGQTHGR